MRSLNFNELNDFTSDIDVGSIIEKFVKKSTLSIESTIESVGLDASREGENKRRRVGGSGW